MVAHTTLLEISCTGSDKKISFTHIYLEACKRRRIAGDIGLFLLLLVATATKTHAATTTSATLLEVAAVAPTTDATTTDATTRGDQKVCGK